MKRIRYRYRTRRPSSPSTKLARLMQIRGSYFSCLFIKRVQAQLIGNYILDNRQESGTINVKFAIFALMVSLLMLSIFSLDNGDKLFSIIGGSIALLGLLYVIGRSAIECFRWHKPLDITYLIPQNTYPCNSFPGNPDTEQYPKSLDLFIGEQFIMFRIKPRIDAIIDDEALEFSDGGPEVSGNECDPYLPQTDIFSGKVQDWWGRWHNPQSIKMFRRGEYYIRSFTIKAHNEYRGRAKLTFWVKGKKNVIIYELPINIEAQPNQPKLDKAGSLTK